MIKKTFSYFLLTTLFISTLNAQNQNIETVIKYHDSIFWNGFNSCNLEIIKSYISEDLEFYHDKAGVTHGLKVFMDNLKNGLCSDTEKFKLRREEVEGSIKIYPMANYGAIISGNHVFYVTENGNPEYKDGIAKFTHLWVFKDNIWKMSRVLSYDHKSP